MELSEMTRENTVLFVCDVQEKKRARPVKWAKTFTLPCSTGRYSLLSNYRKAIVTVLKALEFSKIIGIPILKSEHVYKNDKPLSRGKTHDAVQAFFDNLKFFKNPVSSVRAKEYKKHKISMITDQISSEIVGNSSKSMFYNTKFAAIVGLETHLAVWKTCEDLKNLGIMPIILVDGVCSANDLDSDLCLKMMKKDGMMLMTLEMWAHRFGIEQSDDGFGEIFKLFENPTRKSIDFKMCLF